MNLERLRVFLQIVDSGTMSAAARAVHLTQPALSRTLKLLEDEVGVPLFERRGRTLVLTAGGRALVPRARALLAASEQLALETRRSAERSYFDVRVGIVDSVATYLFPRTLPALRKAFPELAIKLSTARTSVLLGRVRAGELDLAIVAHSGAPSGTRARRLGPYSLQFYGRRDLYPSLRGVESEAQVRAFPMVEINPGHGEPSLVPEDAFSYAVASNVATVKALVLAGFGVGDLPDFMLSSEERKQLCRAQVAHDPDCGLFLVSAPHFTGATEQRLTTTLAKALSSNLRGR
ncbi:MAG TPA: LysR family transcriptional regulator [Polyangiales bacterium]